MNNLIKVLDAGYRERQALLRHHNAVFPTVSKPGYIAFLTWLESVHFDTSRDEFIFPDGSILTMKEIEQ